MNDTALSDTVPHTQWIVEEDTKVRVGLPANDPVVLKDAVAKYLKTQKNVKRAWLVLMEKGGERSLLMVVDFFGDRQTTFNGIASVAVPKLREGEMLDIMPATNDGFCQTIKDYPPFYKRKTFWFF
jgi:hypothetical protein